MGRLASNLPAQCAMCRTALTNSPEGQEMIAGFDNAILFLLAVPLVIFGTVVFLLWRAARKRALVGGRNPVDEIAASFRASYRG